MRQLLRPVPAVLAVTATIILIVAVVLLPEPVVYVNVPAGELTGIGLESQTNAVAIVDAQEALATLPAIVTDETRALDGPLLVAATVVMGGDSRWCSRLAVEYDVGADGDIQLDLISPRWARLLAGGCGQDVPAPAAVIVSLPADAVDSADRVTVNYGVDLGSIMCAPSPPGMESQWSCDPAPQTRRD